MTLIEYATAHPDRPVGMSWCCPIGSRPGEHHLGPVSSHIPGYRGPLEKGSHAEMVKLLLSLGYEQRVTQPFPGAPCKHWHLTSPLADCSDLF